MRKASKIKNILTAVLAVALLSGCAKVERQVMGCTKSPPARPVIDSIVYADLGTNIYLGASAPVGSILIWTSPKGEVSIGYPELYITPDELGTWSVVDRLDSCVSDRTYFTLTSSDPHLSYGTPPCSPYSPVGVFVSNTGTTVIDVGTQSYHLGTVGGITDLEIYASPNSNSVVNLRIKGTTTRPQPGTYYDLDSNANDYYGGSYAYILTPGGQYRAVSGRVYFTTYNGTAVAMMCAVVFRPPFINTPYPRITGALYYY